MQAARTLVGGTAAVAALAVAAPPIQALAALQHDSAAEPFGLLVAAVSLLAWALVGWLALVLLVTAAGQAPGWTGRAATTLAGRLAPRTVRRAAELALGLTVAAGALGAVPASAADAAPGTAPRAPAPALGSLDWPSPAAPALDWPATPAASPVTRAATPVRPATPASPVTNAATPATSPSTPAARPVTRVMRPAVPAAAATSDPAVVVRPGDTLWGIAADHLPPGAGPAAVARAWPSWWAANRDAVGGDPDLIHPGTRLTAPTDPSAR